MRPCLKIESKNRAEEIAYWQSTCQETTNEGLCGRTFVWHTRGPGFYAQYHRYINKKDSPHTPSPPTRFQPASPSSVLSAAHTVCPAFCRKTSSPCVPLLACSTPLSGTVLDGCDGGTPALLPPERLRQTVAILLPQLLKGWDYEATMLGLSVCLSLSETGCHVAQAELELVM